MLIRSFSDHAGSSPRLRGTRKSPTQRSASRRFIPAPAGNAPRAVCRSVGLRGSSPRLRGTHLRELYAREDRRFIPAPAGNAPWPSAAAVTATVHPRACGERDQVVQQIKHGIGSSPRLRGTRVHDHLRAGRSRFIPAPAGNAQRRTEYVRRGSVHPRACGEHWVSSRMDHSTIGSSPRLRGTQCTSLSAWRRKRGSSPRLRGTPTVCV